MRQFSSTNLLAGGVGGRGLDDVTAGRTEELAEVEPLIGGDLGLVDVTNTRSRPLFSGKSGNSGERRRGDLDLLAGGRSGDAASGPLEDVINAPSHSSPDSLARSSLDCTSQMLSPRCQMPWVKGIRG